MNSLRRALIDFERLNLLPTEELVEVNIAANDQSMTIIRGISAIGEILAGAALNDDIGLNTDAVADLGKLLQSLGKLSVTLSNIEAIAGSHLRYRCDRKET